MANLATLCHDPATNTWTAVYKGKVLAKSVGGESSKDYIIHRITNGHCARAIKLGVTGFSNLDATPPSQPNVLDEEIKNVYRVPLEKVSPTNELSVAERYEFLDECVDIVIRNVGIRSLIITGEGSLGKTFHTKQRIREAGLISTEEAIKLATTLTPEEQAVADRILERMQECKKQAIEYYKENGLPKVKGDDEDEDDDEAVDELELTFGEVNFTALHTSSDIHDRACGGRFFPGSCNYQFNIKLAVQNPDEYYDQVVPHEVAHHIQWVLFPKSMKKLKGHGKEWKSIMTDVFQLSPDRYHQMDTTDVKLAPDLAGDYHYVKGYSSAKGLFRTLFENKKKLVVFDDCDAAWQNTVSANLLKAALDSDDERWVTWNVEGSSNDDLPKSFLFEGRVIFISNVSSKDFPQPLISRSLRAELELSIDERFERMEQILDSEHFAPEAPPEIKREAFEFLRENRDIAAEISSRSLLNVIRVRNSGSKMWRQIARANIA